jgi:hypothetical protein
MTLLLTLLLIPDPIGQDRSCKVLRFLSFQVCYVACVLVWMLIICDVLFLVRLALFLSLDSNSYSIPYQEPHIYLYLCMIVIVISPY